MIKTFLSRKNRKDDIRQPYKTQEEFSGKNLIAAGNKTDVN